MHNKNKFPFQKSKRQHLWTMCEIWANHDRPFYIGYICISYWDQQNLEINLGKMGEMGGWAKFPPDVEAHTVYIQTSCTIDITVHCSLSLLLRFLSLRW